MVRRLRRHFSNGFYHVILRGNASEEIFFEEKDRCKMSLLIQEGIERFGHKVFAYCFMTNHVHLAIQVGEIPLSRIMQNLSFRYTGYINKRYGRVGHLFQGRYKAILVGGEAYLKELVRYIHLNPVRAGIVPFPGVYKWSSHNAYLGESTVSWVTTNYVLSLFGERMTEAVNRYKKFIAAGIGLDEDLVFEKGLKEGVVGDEQFVSNTIQQGPKRIVVTNNKRIAPTELVQKVCDFYGIDVETLQERGKSRKTSRVRTILAYLAQEMGWMTLEELSLLVRRDASGLSRSVARLAGKSEEFRVLSDEIDKVRFYLKQMSEYQA